MSFFSAVGEYFHNLWKPSNYPKNFGGFWWNPINLKNYWGGIGNTDPVEYFSCIPELNAIINMGASAFSNGILKVVNDKGEEQIDDALNKRLQNPNWFQGQKEFMRQARLWHSIYGNEYIYLFFPVGFEPETSLKALYPLPPNLVTAEVDSTLPYFFYSSDNPPNIIYNVNNGEGKNYPLSSDTVVHTNDNNIRVNKLAGKKIITGQTKIEALHIPIQNIKMAYESRGVILKYRGALGILSNDSKDVAGAIAVEDKERDEIQKAYRNYGGLDGQFQLIITNANLKWQQMTISPDKLGLFQECEEDFNKMLDAYNTPAELFVRVKQSTYENRKQAEKGYYQNTIIPAANEWVSALNNKIMQESKNKIVVDYSHLPIFQEDFKLRADAVSTMVNALSKMLQDGAITIEEYKIELAKFGIGNKI